MIDFKKKAEEIAVEFTIRDLRVEMANVIEKALKEAYNQGIEEGKK